MIGRLCYEFFKIGAISFGGGLCTIPHIYNLARATGWYTEAEITNMLTISQVTPGPLACNVATFVGFKLDGFWAGFLATVCFMIPAIIFMGIVFKMLDAFKNSKIVKVAFKYIRAYSVAIIFVSSFTIFKMAFLKDTSISGVNNILPNIEFRCVMLAIFLYKLKKKFELNVVSIMGIAAVIGVIFRF